MSAEEQVYVYLKNLGIDFDIHEHEAVFNMEESNKLEIGFKGPRPKNILLKHKSNHYYLVTILGEKRVDTKLIGSLLEIPKRFSFASEEELQNILHVKRGSVSPFSIINADPIKVSLIVDKELLNNEILSFHPNINTATVDLSSKSFMKFLDSSKVKTHYFDI